MNQLSMIFDYDDLVRTPDGAEGYITGLPCPSGPLYEVEVSLQPPDIRYLPGEALELIRSAG